MRDDFEILLENYIESESLLKNFPSNPHIPEHLANAKVKEDIKTSIQMPELNDHIGAALTLLNNDECTRYISLDDFNEMKKQFKKSTYYLSNFKFSKSLNINYAEILHIKEKTLDDILKIAVHMFNEKRVGDCMSLLVLLTVLKPEDFDYWFRLGIAAHQLENYPLAIKAFTSSLHLNPEYLGAVIFLTSSYLKNNQNDLAKVEFGNAKNLMQKKPTDSEWKELFQEMERNFRKI